MRSNFNRLPRISRAFGLAPVWIVPVMLIVSGCRPSPPDMDAAMFEDRLNEIAERYVRLVLAVGEVDADYIDAYFGPPEWREEVRAEGLPLDTLRVHSADLLASLPAAQPTGDPVLDLRRTFLETQMRSVESRIRMVQGERFPFDDEARALYDADPPHLADAHFDSLLAELDLLLPGSGTIQERFERLRADVVIPASVVDTVFVVAIDEARRRTRAHIELPAGEEFTLEFVRDKSWSGYNWYQGDARSLIQINIDLPVYLDRAVDLAAHEGYPGHHVFNLLLEQKLARERGWPEFLVYVLFSPQSLIAEGTANFGIDVAFPGEERLAFERDVLAPLAGIDPDAVTRNAAVRELVSKLSYAGNEAARRYLDGLIDADGAAAYLTRYGLMSPERARQRVRFIDTYRSYVINYNLGLDLVRAYVERLGGTEEAAGRRWEVFTDLLATPRTPGQLAE